jgi:quercetin dioxygenase-like cupin family protein
MLAAGLLVFGGWLAQQALNAEAARRSQTLIPQLENDAVHVWKTVLAPHEAIGMHRHEHGRVVVALKGGILSIPQEHGETRKLVLETGKAYWLDADPPGELHGDRNDSSKPLELMVIEMQGNGGHEPNRQSL